MKYSRLAIGGLARSNDQQTLLTLNLVSGALKALLRPSALSSVDKGPAEALSGKFFVFNLDVFDAYHTN